MAIAIALALLGFNDLGRSLTLLFFSETNFFQLSPRFPKMNKNSTSEGKKQSRFLSATHLTNRILPSYGFKVCESVVAKCELVLWGTSPVDLIRLICPFKPYLAKKISLQSSNCNILGLAATMAFLAHEARFTQI